MNERQAQLLKAIIDQFISTAIPVGSKKLLESAEFSLSSATIRSEMSFLESEGFLEQPHTSAGRVPTVKGYRTYVEEFMKPSVYEKAVRVKFETLRDRYIEQKNRERAYEAVALLSHMIQNVSFATVPHRERLYYLGLSSALKQPEFQTDARFVSDVIEVLEERLSDFLENVELDDRVRYFIGEKDLCPEFASCTLMLTRYHLGGYRGVIGILGPVRMPYGYNAVALDMVTGLLRGH